MTKKEMKQKVENMIVDQMNESGLTEEEVIETTMLSFVYQYFNGEIEEEEMLYILNELGYECDLPLLKQEKEKRIAKLAKRRTRKECCL